MPDLEVGDGGAGVEVPAITPQIRLKVVYFLLLNRAELFLTLAWAVASLVQLPI